MVGNSGLGFAHKVYAVEVNDASAKSAEQVVDDNEEVPEGRHVYLSHRKRKVEHPRPWGFKS